MLGSQSWAERAGLCPGESRIITNTGRIRILRAHDRPGGQDIDVYAYDRNGWLRSWSLAGQHYRLGHGGDVLRVFTVRASVYPGQKSVRFSEADKVGEAEKTRMLEGARAVACEAVARVREVVALAREGAALAREVAAHADEVAAHARGVAAHAGEVAAHARGVAAHAGEVATHARGVAALARMFATLKRGAVADADKVAVQEGGAVADAEESAAQEGEVAIHAPGDVPQPGGFATYAREVAPQGGGAFAQEGGAVAQVGEVAPQGGGAFPQPGGASGMACESGPVGLTGWPLWDNSCLKRPNVCLMRGNSFPTADDLSRIVAFSAVEVAQRFSAIWRPISILPPDQYRALVVQLTEGCSYNKCAFCDFYKDRPFRIKPLPEFAGHVDEAVDFFARELEECFGWFLADANAASIDMSALVAALGYLRAVGERLAERNPSLNRVSSFLDSFTQSNRTVAQWRELRKLGLHTLYLGVESGADRVLRKMRKAGSREGVKRMVHVLKEAEIDVGVIVMSGIGGKLAEEHRDSTISLLNELPLDGDDRIYVSEYCPPSSELGRSGVEHPEVNNVAPVGRDAVAQWRAEVRRESDLLLAGIAHPAYPAGPLRSLYDVRQFVY